jgi:hypothetical protein
MVELQNTSVIWNIIWVSLDVWKLQHEWGSWCLWILCGMNGVFARVLVIAELWQKLSVIWNRILCYSGCLKGATIWVRITVSLDMLRDECCVCKSSFVLQIAQHSLYDMVIWFSLSVSLSSAIAFVPPSFLFVCLLLSPICESLLVQPQDLNRCTNSC